MQVWVNIAARLTTQKRSDKIIYDSTTGAIFFWLKIISAISFNRYYITLQATRKYPRM